MNNVQDRLLLRDLNIEVPLTRKNDILFTRQERIKLDEAFLHPSNDKLLNLLHFTRHFEVNAETSDIFNDIVSHCRNCQHHGPAPIRFKITIPTKESVLFGVELSIDLMFLNGKAFLHIVDPTTSVSGATFLNAHESNYEQSTEGVWIASMEC